MGIDSPGPAFFRVFLSHTSDLRRFPATWSYIDAGESAVKRAGHAVIDMRYFTARDERPAQYCEEWVQRCDVYVGIIGFRYGMPVRDRPTLSHTELEFEAATSARKYRLIFLLSESAEVTAEMILDHQYGDRQHSFRERLTESGLVITQFHNPYELEVLIYQALVELREKTVGQRLLQPASEGPVERYLPEARPWPAALDDPPSRVPIPRESEIIARFASPFAGDRIISHVHTEGEPPFSGEVRAAFNALNYRRRAKGLLGYFPGQRFRLITPPVIDDTYIKLNLAPLNYAFAALMKDPDTDLATKARIRQIIDAVAARMPTELPSSNDPRFGVHSYSLLGTETCLVTRDGYTLLRRRGANVLTARRAWDVSVSGHPTEQDLYGNEVNLNQTIYRKAVDEVGFVNGDGRQIRFTGLHRNRVSGDIDICAIWPVWETAEELRALASGQRAEESRELTLYNPSEPYARDYDSLLVEFEGPIIMQRLEELGVGPEGILPESLVCLELALRAAGSPTIGIALP